LPDTRLTKSTIGQDSPAVGNADKLFFAAKGARAVISSHLVL
jgi:hypothetical protein